MNKLMDGQPENPELEKSPSAGDVTFWTIIGSVLASFFGVQKSANRERDFASGKYWHFIAAGVILVLFFLVAVFAAVQYMLATTPTG